LVCGNHQGQRPRAPRKQAGHTSASDQCQNQLQICLALQQLSTQAIGADCSILLTQTSVSGQSSLLLAQRMRVQKTLAHSAQEFLQRI
jgi:hypothetical protein